MKHKFLVLDPGKNKTIKIMVRSNSDLWNLLVITVYGIAMVLIIDGMNILGFIKSVSGLGEYLAHTHLTR